MQIYLQIKNNFKSINEILEHRYHNGTLSNLNTFFIIKKLYENADPICNSIDNELLGHINHMLISIDQKLKKGQIEDWQKAETEIYRLLEHIKNVLSTKNTDLNKIIRDIFYRYGSIIKNDELENDKEHRLEVKNLSMQLASLKRDSNEFKKALNEQINKAFLDKTTNLDNDAKNLISSIRETKSQADLLYQDAKETLNLVLEYSQANAYDLYANREGKIASVLRIAAIFFMIAAIFMLFLPEIIFFIQILTSETNTLTENLITINYSNFFNELYKRIPISILTLTPGFYLAREANKHRNNQFNNKKIAIKLASVDAYTSRLANKNDKELIKKKMAEQIFLENKETHITKEDHSLAKELIELLRVTKEANNK